MHNIPTAEAIRLSNALDNLGSAALAIEGAVYETERALVQTVRRIYDTDPGFAAEVFDGLDRRTLKAIVRSAVSFGVSVSFVEAILAVKEEAGND
jgi:hypothetical protein